MAGPPLALPARKAASPRSGSAGSFIGDLVVLHGPADLLGRFFLDADSAVRARGIRLDFGRFDVLADLNRAHLESWGLINSVFDARKVPTPSDTCFCLFGRAGDGRIVTAQAARMFDIGASSVADAVDDMRLFYPGVPRPTPEVEQCRVDMPAARQMSGRIAFVGGLWVHPDFRGRQLSQILPRISRAYAFTSWRPDHAISFASRRLVENRTIYGYGWRNVAYGFERRKAGALDFEGAIVWMSAVELLADVAQSLAAGQPPLSTALPGSGATAAQVDV